jgi:arylsulfatase A-like enzyme
MTDQPNLLFIWTDQQAANTLGVYGNDVVQTPNIDALAEKGTVFENAYVSQSICGPSRSTIMTGQYPHTTGITTNNVPLRENEQCLPELGDFDSYRTMWIGKWHLGDEIFRQHGFDEWVSTEDCYRQFYSTDRNQFAHSDYHNYLIDHGFEPDMVEDDGYEWFSREFVAKNVPEEHSKPAFMAREAQKFIRETEDQPFMLHMMFLEPHQPYTGPRDDQYSASDVTLRPNVNHEGFDDQPDRIRFFREAVRRGDVTAHPAKEYLSSPPTKEEWRELISMYWGLVSQVDAHVGTVLDELDDQGLTDETMIVYTSDHGEMMGSHGLIQKMNQFEEAIKVPLIVDLPSDMEETRERVKHPVSQIDLVPTILDTLGQPQPAHLQGGSWLPYLRNDGDLPQENVIIEWNGTTCVGILDMSTMWEAGDRTNLDEFVPRPDSTAEEIWADMETDRDIMKVMSDPIRTIVTPDGWKLNYRRSGKHELYNLNEDPYERQNLADEAEHEETIHELYTEILSWQRRTRDPVYL